MEIGAKLRELRVAKNLSQDDPAVFIAPNTLLLQIVEGALMSWGQAIQLTTGDENWTPIANASPPFRGLQ
jgi:hypothetical protein